MANFIAGIISLVIGLVMISSVLITTVKNTNQSYDCYLTNGSPTVCSWSSAEIALWGIITLVSIAGIIYGATQVFGMS